MNHPGEPPLRLKCPSCGARLKVRADQAGKRLRCSKCRSSVVVPVSGEAVASDTEFGSEQDRPLEALSDRPPGKSAQTPGGLVAVVCPVCRTRLHPPARLIGQKIACPDCYSPIVVPSPPKPKRRVNLPVQHGDDYQLSEPVQRRSQVELSDYLTDEDQQQEGSTAREPQSPERRELPASLRNRPSLPPWPLVGGVFNFPLYTGVWLRWAILSTWAALLLFMLHGAIQLANQGGVLMIGSLLFSGVVVALGAMWVATTSASCMAILQDTATGSDQIEQWPDSVWLDWMFDSFYFINCTVLSLAPGLLLGWTGVVDDLVQMILTGAIAFVLFPIVLLSMLESNSMFIPISPPVLGSLLSSWWAWLRFYFAAAILLAGIGVQLYAVALGDRWALAPVAFLLTATLLIYFRLLGRLAWVCADTSAVEREEELRTSPEGADAREQFDSMSELRRRMEHVPRND